MLRGKKSKKSGSSTEYIKENTHKSAGLDFCSQPSMQQINLKKKGKEKQKEGIKEKDRFVVYSQKQILYQEHSLKSYLRPNSKSVGDPAPETCMPLSLSQEP